MDTIIGRERDLARVAEVLAGSRALVVHGDPGIGKTVLLDAAVRQAREQGIRVLTARGSEAERDLPFAGLHQLLRPVFDQVDALPDRPRTALVNAFGTLTEPAPLDKMLISLAVLTLVWHVPRDDRDHRRLGQPSPVLVGIGAEPPGPFQCVHRGGQRAPRESAIGGLLE